MLFKLAFNEKSLLFSIFVKMAGEKWVKKGDIYEAVVTHRLAKSEFDLLNRIAGEVIDSKPLFTPEEMVTPGNETGGVVE